MSPLDYNALVRDLLNLDVANAVAANKLAVLLSDLTHGDTVTLLNKIRDLETAVNRINLLRTTPVAPDPLSQRERFINRLERLAESEGKTLPVKAPPGTTVDEPYFNQMDVIYCNFGGIGREYDGPHFAIVWEDNHAETELLVIPTTSQYTKEYADEFNIGRVTGLPARDTIVSVKKLMRISRKRVIHHRFKQGQIHRGFKDRIENAIAIAINQEKPLEYYVRNECRSALPVNIQTIYSSIRFTPVQDVHFEHLAYINLSKMESAYTNDTANENAYRLC